MTDVLDELRARFAAMLQKAEDGNRKIIEADWEGERIDVETARAGFTIYDVIRPFVTVRNPRPSKSSIDAAEVLVDLARANLAVGSLAHERNCEAIWARQEVIDEIIESEASRAGLLPEAIYARAVLAA
jgi:hypothetical protein